MKDMHNEVPTIEQLRETVRHRRLTPAELRQVQDWLKNHPDQAEDWEREIALTESVFSLPDVSVASNFPARVMEAVQREEHPSARRRRWSPLRWGWLPRLGFAVVVVTAGILSYNGWEQSRRAAYVESVSVVSEVGPLPSAQALEDFDAIRALTPAPAADIELIALME